MQHTMEMDHVRHKLGMLDYIINKYQAPVPMDYLYDLPKEFRQHSFTDTNKKHPSGLAQIAASAATSQVFGRPFENFTEEQIRQAFYLGDTDGAPPGSPARNTVEVPRPRRRKFFSEPEVEAPPPSPPPPSSAQQLGGLPPLVPPPSTTTTTRAPSPGVKRAKGGGGSRGTSPARQGAAAAAAAAAIALPFQPPPTVSEIRAPSPLILPAPPLVDIAKLTGQRRISDLTHPEVNTIAAEVTKKLRARKSRLWKKQNPLDIDITPQNCAKMGIPHYFDVIKRPMTLPTIAKKVRAQTYKTIYEYIEDVELMINNALAFNREGDPVYTFSKETREVLYKLLEKHRNEYALLEDEGRPLRARDNPPA